MQEALPYKTWTIFPQYNPHAKTTPSNHNTRTNSGPIQTGQVKKMVSENAVIILSKQGCCMSHVINRLLQGLGVNPTVYEVNDDDENRVVDELEDAELPEERLQFPAVFIGGRLFGGLDRIMTSHISGDLVPVLKQAGALWL